VPIHPPVSPTIFKRILELDGFTVIHEDEFNWSLFKDEFGLVQPILIPKKPKLIAVDIMSNVLHRAKMPPGTYQDLLAKTKSELPL
jgi:hypothetical protein